GAAVDQQFVSALGSLIRSLSTLQPPRKVPSYSECRFCPIGARDCPERVSADAPAPAGVTDDF
ncbi:MAG: hypothetical protein OXN21_13735, partial [Chloroflexota bacterium]|nr:hypothetical protein [Chloroflexota bacterium]